MEVCIFYVESWLRGNGCIPVNFKMEDAATAEISRAQVRVLTPPTPPPQLPAPAPDLIQTSTNRLS